MPLASESGQQLGLLGAEFGVGQQAFGVQAGQAFDGGKDVWRTRVGRVVGLEAAWQRCRGAVVHNSSYGVEGNGATGTSFPGMGVPGRYITASQGTAVMFVEVAFDYEPITPITVFENRRIVYTAAFNVRDNRDLTRLYAGGPVARCNVFSAVKMRKKFKTSRNSPMQWPHLMISM